MAKNKYDGSKKFGIEGGTIIPSQCAYCAHNHGPVYTSCAVYGTKPDAYFYSPGRGSPGDGDVCPDREEKVRTVE